MDWDYTAVTLLQNSALNGGFEARFSEISDGKLSCAVSALMAGTCGRLLVGSHKLTHEGFLQP